MKDKDKLRKAQLIMLEMLKYLDTFCKKYKIEYWIDAGTLLGAVRNKGFIPWDDDIDVCMTSSNYKKFMEKYEKSCEDKYFLLKPFSKNYEINILKLKNKENFLIEFEKQKYHKGIHIDIFEFKEYKNKDNRLDELISKLYLIKKIGLLSIHNAKISKIYIFMRYLLLKLLPLDLIINFLEYFEIQKNGNYLGYSLKSGGFTRVLKTDIFPLKKIQFENDFFYAPNNINEYLKTLYGNNYMELPAEEKRTTHAWKIVLKEERGDK
ncbi:LicD family protein [Fusobacterium hominis]|uniref:LicD family protein n=1 Tax=Fusobacterium hominis TaxID=2764326 RepID=UPI0022DF5EAD|nr:LicD family protein [Fusobacterium hominis]